MVVDTLIPANEDASQPLEVTFDGYLEQLQQSVKMLESGQLPLEKALIEFEKGLQSAQKCSQTLSKIEQTVQVLLKAHAVNNLETTPLSTTDTALTS